MPGPEDHWMGPLPAAPGCDCHVCRPDDAYEAQDRHTIDTVLRHGWQVLLVSDAVGCDDPHHDDHTDDGEDAGPPFAYTVGLGHRCGHPELLVSGLDPGLMHRMLNDVAQRVMRGRRLRPGDVLEDVLAGAPVVLTEVTDEALEETVLWSGWFHRRAPEALQLVWPTRTGLFAWQPGAPADLDELQPPAWREPMTLPAGLEQDPPWPFPVPPDRKAFSCTHVVDDGSAILWMARQADPERGEDWSLHCGASGHDTGEMRLVHLAHLVRAAPSLREIADLGLDCEAERATTDAEWVSSRLG
ncbi:DUF4262 domain-containing protein [Phycicoccus sonneratiae]|uniref:DUF4262 domain-containing protein n=1 Tax=Phycicoccus sonneratiae TaxID=2807628 RepID=A0ABS2CLL4_9MICO|nr:DUF4262 domain-containing protein [Phycicoccus sonneraticus]MBM6400363.1 DUF4262 domain-containing protein [Phycicoccus sonneraticus]